MSGTSRIPLADAIEDLRAELLRAATAGVGQPLQFRLKPVELEIKLVIKREAEAKGGIKFYVLDFSGGGKLADETTHTLKLVLEPVGQDGQTEFLISETGGERPDGEAPDPRPEG